MRAQNQLKDRVNTDVYTNEQAQKIYELLPFISSVHTKALHQLNKTKPMAMAVKMWFNN